ncbi:hypothetical protein ACFL35_21830 [Candidatus Riflebacteria bacterium]
MRLLVLNALFLFLFLSIAEGNMGGPLVTFVEIHLVFMNLLIAFIEALPFYFIFSVNFWGCLFYFLLANYFSLLPGIVIFPLIEKAFPVDIFNFWYFHYGTWLFAFVATLILEFPIVYFYLIKRNKKDLRQVLFFFILVNLVTGGALFGFYQQSSSFLLFKNTSITKDKSMAKKIKGEIFFIGENRKEVFKSSVGLDKKESIYKIRPDSNIKEIMLGYSLEEDLIPRCLGIKSGDGKIVHVSPGNFKVDGEKKQLDYSNYYFPWKLPLQDLRGASRTWDVRVSRIPHRGIRLSHKKKSDSFILNLETPFIRWRPESVTIFPGEKLIFQLNNQILLFDIEKRKLLPLCRGYNPLLRLFEFLE